MELCQLQDNQPILLKCVQTVFYQVREIKAAYDSVLTAKDGAHLHKEMRYTPEWAKVGLQL